MTEPNNKSQNYVLYLIIGLVVCVILYWTGNLSLQSSAGLALACLIVYILFFWRQTWNTTAVTYKPIDHEKELPVFKDKLLKMGFRVQFSDTSGEPKYGIKGAEPYLQYYKGMEYNHRTNAYDRPFLLKVSVVNRALVDIEHDHIHFENAFVDWAGNPKGVGRSAHEPIYRPVPIQIKSEARKVDEAGEDAGVVVVDGENK